MIQLGKKYKLTMRTSNRDLTFTGTVTAIEEGFITFTDKFDTELNYNLNSVISYEEISDE